MAKFVRFNTRIFELIEIYEEAEIVEQTLSFAWGKLVINLWFSMGHLSKRHSYNVGGREKDCAITCGLWWWIACSKLNTRNFYSKFIYRRLIFIIFVVSSIIYYLYFCLLYIIYYLYFLFESKKHLFDPISVKNLFDSNKNFSWCKIGNR